MRRSEALPLSTLHWMMITYPTRFFANSAPSYVVQIYNIVNARSNECDTLLGNLMSSQYKDEIEW